MSGTWDDEARRPWRSARWSLELRGDELADIAYDGVVVLRSARAVVRDHDWRTAPLVIDDVDARDDAIVIALHSSGLGSSFAGTVRVHAHGDRLQIVCDLTSRQPFDTNRTGLVVLHPPTLAGTPLRVVHSAAEPEETRFPPRISAHQPVRDIAALAWTAGGVGVALTFDGDVFEMEDQRNWTDASFKTYSRPLDLPFPYRVAAGERVTQTVTIEATASASAPVIETTGPAPAAVIELRPGGAFPRLGLGAATAPDPAPPLGSPLGSHVVADIDLADPNWRAALDRAGAAGLPVEVRLVLADDDPDALRAAARALRGRRTARVTAFPATGPARHVSDGPTIRALRAALRAADVDVPVVGGTRAHFTELNREHHRLPDGLDGIVLSSTPLFHSRGTDQLVEALAMQRRVAQEAVDIASGLPVHIGPVTLRPRFNDVATTPPPRPGRTDLAEGYGAQLLDADDPRHDSDELAAWTIASAAAFAVPGVAALTFFEEWGPRGIRTAAGRDRPVAAALRALADVAGPDGRACTLLHGDSPDGLVWAVGGRGDDGGSVLVANLDRVPRVVRVEPGGTRTVPAGAFAILPLTAPSAHD